MANSVKSVKWLSQSGSEIEAVITVTKKVVELTSYADGWNIPIGSEIEKTMTVKIMINGKLHSEETQMPKVIETGNYMESTKADMRAKGAYAYITDTIVTNKEHYNEIMTAIEEAKAEVEAAFIAENTEAAAEAAAEEIAKEEAKEEAKVTSKIEWANRVIAEASQRTVLTEKEEAIWRTNYNNLHNEGGDGYIPVRVTKEDVEFAKSIIRK